MQPELYLMIDGQPEFNVKDKLPFVDYMGLDSDNPVVANNYQEFTGQDGSLFNSSVIQKRTVNLKFYFHIDNYPDYRNKAHQINQFFHQKRIYRIRDNSEPALVQFCRPTTFPIQPVDSGSHDCTISVPMENPTGYKFSRYDSLNQNDLWDDYPLSWDVPIIQAEDYHFQDEFSFQLLNPGGVPVDPYAERHDLKIYLDWSGPLISLRNLTNSSSYAFYGQNDHNRRIVIDGCETYQDGAQISEQTDFGSLKLEPGFNHIVVGGCRHFEARFKFPFIYV
ncbi:phage tail family protein [Fructilactobacillus myrtifloralis]|uniref:Phage tail family protein n=1 Tax=Fructilactobacillus myrtifloralis TaxID=2940301 RepID=A0ABY5BQ84_9LACO|nr:phage tail domain-containing protein [Fructilactobacillus myrtifloralis]USS85086.1 phage tail family protein [Fructilactobacillus myrtifloralis]